MSRFPRLYVLTIALTLLGFGGGEVRAAAVAAAAAQTGTASWYGGRWIGRKLASGERYRAGDLTAAHRKLPFGTMVRVTNLKNQRSTVVRINNRGPWGRGRIIDLSESAATELAMRSAGTARVRLDVLSNDESAAAKSATSAGARIADTASAPDPRSSRQANRRR